MSCSAVPKIMAAICTRPHYRLTILRDPLRLVDRRRHAVADQPLVTTGGGGGGGFFPYAPVPTIGNLPMIGIGALPTTGAGGGGWGVGISAASAALAKASVEIVAMRNFVMVMTPLRLRNIYQILTQLPVVRLQQSAV